MVQEANGQEASLVIVCNVKMLPQLLAAHKCRFHLDLVNTATCFFSFAARFSFICLGCIGCSLSRAIHA